MCLWARCHMVPRATEIGPTWATTTAMAVASVAGSVARIAVARSVAESRRRRGKLQQHVVIVRRATGQIAIAAIKAIGAGAMTAATAATVTVARPTAAASAMAGDGVLLAAAASRIATDMTGRDRGVATAGEVAAVRWAEPAEEEEEAKAESTFPTSASSTSLTNAAKAIAAKLATRTTAKCACSVRGWRTRPASSALIAHGRIVSSSIPKAIGDPLVEIGIEKNEVVAAAETTQDKRQGAMKEHTQ
mmetsp:Transcript_77043/g.127091  ORF Transcript_77043/g.127091 Transcript_77043/m.127091 type:complete len:247 (+) Transcript_77043:671-1411(+)